ncbi:MAG: hypothetical protein WCJ30_16485 [Deltaproteobacteria bacterium]
MNIDPAALLASLLIGSVGLSAFMYGKKQSRLPQMVVGAALIVYPYFVPNVWAMVAIAVGLLGGLYGALRMGL